MSMPEQPIQVQQEHQHPHRQPDGRHQHRPSGGPVHRVQPAPPQAHHQDSQMGTGPALPPKSPRMQLSPIRNSQKYEPDASVYPPQSAQHHPPSITVHPAPPNEQRHPTHPQPKTPLSAPPSAPRSPLSEKLKQTFVNREAMSRTWARKSYVDELDAVTDAGFEEGRVEARAGAGGVRSAPASVVGEEDLEAQSQSQMFSTPRSRPVSIYASPAAVAQFRALPPVGPGGQVISSHPAMRV